MDRREGTVLVSKLLTPRFAPTALSSEGNNSFVKNRQTDSYYSKFDQHIDTDLFFLSLRFVFFLQLYFFFDILEFLSLIANLNQYILKLHIHCQSLSL